MLLKRGRVYDFRYGRYKEDFNPMVLVIYSDSKDTMGINLHYLTKVETKGYKYRYQASDVVQENLERWKMGKFKYLWEFLESETIKHLSSKALYEVFKVKFPLIPKNCYRHYKNEFLSVYGEHDPASLIETRDNRK
jgi:hypothetical protein